MNITHRQSTVATRLANPLAHGPIERAFGHLAALMHLRNARRIAPNPGQKPAVRPTRSELFRQMQHEKWLGKTPTTVRMPTAARPKDLHRRPLQDPNA